MRAKRFRNYPPVRWSIAILFSLAVRVIYYLNRVHYAFPESALPYLYGQKPAIFCFWHGRLMMQPFIDPPTRRMHVLMSQHRDGRFVSSIMRCFGIYSVRGSRSRDAARALRNLVSITTREQNICITPDGPRGPSQQAAHGPAFLASHSGYPIIAVSFSSTRHVRLRSWDRFMLSLPFGTICFTASEPLFVVNESDDATIRKTTQTLQLRLDSITKQADDYCGVGA